MRIALLALVAAASSAGCSFLFDPGNPGDPIDSGMPPVDARLACDNTQRIDDIHPRYLFEGEGIGESPRWIAFLGCQLTRPTLRSLLDFTPQPVDVVDGSFVVSGDGEVAAMQVVFKIDPSRGHDASDQMLTFDFPAGGATATLVFLDEYRRAGPVRDFHSHIEIQQTAVVHSQFRSMSTIDLTTTVESNGADGGSGLEPGLGGVGGFAGGADNGSPGGFGEHGGRGDTGGSGAGGGGHATGGFGAGGSGGTFAGDPSLLVDHQKQVGHDNPRGGHGGGGATNCISIDGSSSGGGGGGFIELTARGGIQNMTAGPVRISANGGATRNECGGGGSGGAILLRGPTDFGIHPLGLGVLGGQGAQNDMNDSGRGSFGRLRVDAASLLGVTECRGPMTPCGAVSNFPDAFSAPVLTGYGAAIISSTNALALHNAPTEGIFYQVFRPVDDPRALSQTGPQLLSSDDARGGIDDIVGALEPGLNRVCLFVGNPDEDGNTSADFVCPRDSKYCRFPLSGNCYDIVYSPTGLITP